MQANGGAGRRGIPGLGRLKALHAPRLGTLRHDPLWRDYEDTLGRLLRGRDFADLAPAERQARVEHIISASALAAMAMAALPVPFLDLPVEAAMVQAIARVHGVERPGKRVLLHLAATLGGGLFLRQVLRFVPLAGQMSLLSRVYGATWALGRVANLYFTRDEPPPRSELQQVFRETMARKSAEEAQRLEAVDFERRLGELKELRSRGVITEGEYQAKRRELLAQL